MLPCISLLDAFICYCPQYVLKLFRCWLSSVRCNLLITSFILHTRDLLNQHKVILFGVFFGGKNIHSVTDYTKTHVAVSHKYSLSQMCLVTGLFLNQMQDVFVFIKLVSFGSLFRPLRSFQFISIISFFFDYYASYRLDKYVFWVVTWNFRQDRTRLLWLYH